MCILDVFLKIEVGNRMVIEDVSFGYIVTYVKIRLNKIEFYFCKSIGGILKLSWYSKEK